MFISISAGGCGRSNRELDFWLFRRWGLVSGSSDEAAPEWRRGSSGPPTSSSSSSSSSTSTSSGPPTPTTSTTNTTAHQPPLLITQTGERRWRRRRRIFNCFLRSRLFYSFKIWNNHIGFTFLLWQLLINFLQPSNPWVEWTGWFCGFATNLLVSQSPFFSSTALNCISPHTRWPGCRGTRWPGCRKKSPAAFFFNPRQKIGWHFPKLVLRQF